MKKNCIGCLLTVLALLLTGCGAMHAPDHAFSDWGDQVHKDMAGAEDAWSYTLTAEPHSLNHYDEDGRLLVTGSYELPVMQVPQQPVLSPEEWQVLLSLKESLSPAEFTPCPWEQRAAALGMSPDAYCRIAEALDAKKVIGRFATFLDHQRHSANRSTGTGAAGLFHWTVPAGMEERAGAECGRHICMTHCYWRSGGATFGGAQIMGVVHATTREEVLAHKGAIDAHLAACGIPLLHTSVFWSLRAEIRPSEISPLVYQRWLQQYA